MDLCSSKRKLAEFQKSLKLSSYIHLNTSKILRLWFNYFNWQSYTQLHTWIRNLDKYGKGQGEVVLWVFVKATITGRNKQDSDSAAESDDDDNADDRWWLRKDSLEPNAHCTAGNWTELNSTELFRSVQFPAGILLKCILEVLVSFDCDLSHTMIFVVHSYMRGRPRKTWSAWVRNDMTICNLDGVNPLDRNSWRTSVRRCQMLPTPESGTTAAP